MNPRPLPWLAAAALLAGSAVNARAADLKVETIRLPPLRIEGRLVHAHTQGLEKAPGGYFVTARQEDVEPKRALLLRVQAGGSGWDSWDITPVAPADALGALDHPGGLQSDGDRLWIPLAESRPRGRSVICAFPLAGLKAGRPAKAEVTFPVDDHIGAIAVDRGQRRLLGASWDTETVYVWDFEGRLQQTLRGAELARRELGVATGPGGRAGLTVQDWKIVGDRLFASGLYRGPDLAPAPPESRLMIFTGVLRPGFQQRSSVLPLQEGTEMAREAMAVSGDAALFLPGDLGETNRIFRVRLADLASGGQPQRSRSAP